MIKKVKIELKNIFLKLDKNHIFKNFSLDFSTEGISVVLGANGSGKTILTKIIKGILKVNKGKILINRKNAIGYAPQKVVFLRRNVFDNIAFPLRVRGESEFHVKKKVNFLLKEFDVFDKRFLSARSLSAGNAQYISFIRAIIDDPEVLILDEPCSNLDEVYRKKVELYLKKNKKKKKIIMITHDFLQAKRLGDQILIIERGEFKAKFTKNKFVKNEKSIINNFFS